MDKSVDKRQALCHDFVNNSKLRHAVFGATQFCLDLCQVLKLPTRVALSSLLFIQKFLCEFQWDSIELYTLCGACILITWKYWEDLLPIKNTRKLVDLTREMYRLLVIQDVSDDDEERPLNKLQLAINQLNDTKPKDHLDSKLSSVSDWTMRDGGSEYHRLKERLRLCETCILRCLKYEIGPFELPFDFARYLCSQLWHRNQEYTEQKSPHKKDDSHMSDLALIHFVYLTYALVFDYYRTPFCLLSTSRDIATAAVWKAAIALNLAFPFETSLLNAMSPYPDEKSDMAKFFPISPPHLRNLVQRFRHVYDYLREFTQETQIPRHYWMSELESTLKSSCQTE